MKVTIDLQQVAKFLVMLLLLSGVSIVGRGLIEGAPTSAGYFVGTLAGNLEGAIFWAFYVNGRKL